jgi:putative methionine-R-sulfoxide reductase with GAF domain
MTSSPEHADATEAVERILERGGDADDVLRGVVALLHERFPWVGISFVEGGELVLGPSAGTREQSAAPLAVPIEYDGHVVGRLEVAGEEGDRAYVERVALLVAPCCLVGWDTGGERWTP